MSSSRLLARIQRYRGGLLLAGLLVLIFGTWLYVDVRCLAELPQADDGATMAWLQRWARGQHDWSFVFQMHNGAHPMEMYYLVNLGAYLLNGFWDARFDSLVGCVVHTLEAAAVFLTFRNVLERRDRRWIYPLIFVLFALPFAGYRIAWGFLWADSAPLVFALPALYLAATRGQSWGMVPVIGGLCLLAAVNTGGGCLGALAVALLTIFEAGLNRRITARDATLAAVCLAIFLLFYLQMSSSAVAHPGLKEALGAFFKALAWPTVFVPGAGILTFIPFVVLVVTQMVRPGFRRGNVAFVTGAFGLLVLIAVATGAMRGDNNNNGMPSGRYLGFFLPLPLVTAVALCLLYRASAGRWRIGCAVLGAAWLGSQFVGFTVQTVYRVIPFNSQETGEWNEPQKEVLYRRLARGELPLAPYLATDEETLYMTTTLVESLQAQVPPPAMTVPMLAGFDLQPGSQGNYTINGFHPSYQPRPARVYRGSFDRENLAATDKWFVSGPFQPQAAYLTMDLMVDKKARFSNYHLDGLQLTLVDQTDGSRTELLPKLAHTYPFVLRDWEEIYARVTPGHTYRIESRDTTPAQWLAFSEPLEGGRLTPLTVSVFQSSKFFCLAGLSILALVFYLRWLEGARLTDGPVPA